MSRLWILATCMVAVLGPAVFAAPLPASSSIFAAAEPDPIGGTAFTSFSFPFVAATFSGTLTFSVIDNDTTNPYGGLTFVYQLFNDSSSSGQIERIALNGFAGASVDSSYQAFTGLAPTLNDRDVVGDVIGISFLGAPVGAGALSPGMSSAVFVLQTDAPLFSLFIASVIDGSVATVPTIGPAYFAGPEPSTIALAAMALGSLAFVARPRRACSR